MNPDKPTASSDFKKDPIIKNVENTVEARARFIFSLIKSGEKDELRTQLEKDPGTYFNQIYLKVQESEWSKFVLKYPSLANEYQNFYEPIKKAVGKVNLASPTVSDEQIVEEVAKEVKREPTFIKKPESPRRESQIVKDYINPETEIEKRADTETKSIEKAGINKWRAKRALKKDPYGFYNKLKEKYEDEFYEGWETLPDEEKDKYQLDPEHEIRWQARKEFESRQRKNYLSRIFPKDLSLEELTRLTERFEGEFWQKLEKLPENERSRYNLSSDFIIRKQVGDEVQAIRKGQRGIKARAKLFLKPVETVNEIRDKQEEVFWENQKPSEKEANSIYRTTSKDLAVQKVNYAILKSTQNEVDAIKSGKRGLLQKINYSRNPLKVITLVQNQNEEKYWREFNETYPDKAEFYKDSIPELKKVYVRVPKAAPSLQEALKTAGARKDLLNVQIKEIVTEEPLEKTVIEGSSIRSVNTFITRTHAIATQEKNEEMKGKVESFKNNLVYLGSSELEKASRGIASNLVDLAENNKFVYIYDSEQGSNSFAAKLVDQQVRDLLQDRPELKERIKVIRGRRDFVLKSAGNPNAIIVLPDTVSLTRYRITEQATVISAEGLYTDLSKKRLGKELPGDKIYEVNFASDKESLKNKPWKTVTYYEIAPDATIFGAVTTPDYETTVTEFTSYLGEQGVTSQAPIPVTPSQKAPIPAHDRPSPAAERQKKVGMTKQLAGKALESAGKTIGAGLGGGFLSPLTGFIGSKVGQALSHPIDLLKKTAQVVGGIVLAAGSLLISFVTTAIAQAAVGLLVFVFFVIFVLFIINSGAYIVPPGGFTYTYGPGGPGGPPISYNGSCPIPGGTITCGSLPSPNSCHGSNSYWSFQNSNCSWALPVLAGARCYHNTIPGNVCYQSSANCSEYGLSTDITYPVSPRICGSSAPVYFPSINGQTLNWTRVRGGTACGEYASFTATDGTNVYDMYFVHLQGIVGGGQSGQILGYLGCLTCTLPHAHYELRINGSFVDPDSMCQ